MPGLTAKKAGKEQVSLFVCTEGNDIIKNKRLELERFAKRRCVSGEAALYVSPCKPAFFRKGGGIVIPAFRDFSAAAKR